MRGTWSSIVAANRTTVTALRIGFKGRSSQVVAHPNQRRARSSVLASCCLAGATCADRPHSASCVP